MTMPDKIYAWPTDAETGGVWRQTTHRPLDDPNGPGGTVFLRAEEAVIARQALRHPLVNALVEIASHIADCYDLDDDDLHTLRAALAAMKGGA